MTLAKEDVNVYALPGAGPFICLSISNFTQNHCSNIHDFYTDVWRIFGQESSQDLDSSTGTALVEICTIALSKFSCFYHVTTTQYNITRMMTHSRVTNQTFVVIGITDVFWYCNYIKMVCANFIRNTYEIACSLLFYIVKHSVICTGTKDNNVI